MMKKKILCGLVAGSIIFSLAACSVNEKRPLEVTVDRQYDNNYLTRVTTKGGQPSFTIEETEDSYIITITAPK